jgi:hypothetical protein
MCGYAEFKMVKDQFVGFIVNYCHSFLVLLSANGDT